MNFVLLSSFLVTFLNPIDSSCENGKELKFLLVTEESQDHLKNPTTIMKKGNPIDADKTTVTNNPRSGF